MKNVLFITPSLGFAGAAKMLSFVAEQLSGRGHEVCIVNLKATVDTVTYDRRISDRISVIDVSQLGRKEQILKIRRVAKEMSADIIIGFTEIPNAIARIVGFTLGIPSIMSERGDPKRFDMGKGFKNGLVLKIINSSKGGVFQTEGARDFYCKGLQKRGVVIPNPIFISGDVPHVDHDKREKSVVSVGRLDNFQKRYDVMLDAFKLFSDKHPEYVLKLYGRGSDEKLISEWVSERGLAERVKFMGLTTQPMQDTCGDGMFIITSDFEGISNSLLEAMAVGLPCVSTDHTPGGARLLITDHENGILAPIEDARALAAAMCEFAEDPELAKKCGENAKDVVNRFAPEKIIDMWESYILKLTK
ncbi:MAG: glycosyltransferase family 4 protein [Ruminococcaceae bacterium]|nr:glycosyltransferase family 4 protein [Oscillospiraceae bacterium]